MSAAGNSNAWSGNQDILFVSSVVPPTISPANYIKAGIYSRITTTDVSTYTFLDGAYLPAKERAAAGIVSSCDAAAINSECFGLRAVATASAAAAVQAGQFLIYNNSGIAQPYPLQPDSSYGITIASAGTQNATAAILLGGSLSRFQDGVVFNPDAVEDNLIVAYKNLGQDQKPGFRVRSSRNGGSFDLATLGKVSIGQTTGPLLDCCNLLAHYATGINLMLGVSNGAPGNYAIAAANDYGMVIPIEVKSPLVADQSMVVGGTSYLNGSVDVTGWLTAWGGATISGKLYVAGVFSVAPATPDRNSPCTPGQQTSDHDYNYTCASLGHWKRMRLEDY
jgi:hypothetical protein